MTDIKGDRLYVNLSASQVRRRLKGHGFGARKVHSNGKKRAVIIIMALLPKAPPLQCNPA